MPDPGQEAEPSRTLKIAHDVLYGVKTVLPKTTETIGLLERNLIELAELPRSPDDDQRERAEAGVKFQETVRSRSLAWVLGTSLAFELATLALAALVFCRRDF